MATEVKLPCQAVAVRYVHDVRTGEFLNIGVVLMSVGHLFAGARFLTHWGRVTAAFPSADPVHLRRIARAIEGACDTWVARSRQLELELARQAQDLSALLRDAIALDDASIKFSPEITGVTGAPARSLNELFELYAGRLSEPETRQSRDDADVWRTFVARIANPGILAHLRQHTLRTQHYTLAFDHAWQNGQWNVTQPLSFDMLDAARIREKALTWTGKLTTVQPSVFDTMVYFLVGMPSEQSPKTLRDAASDAFAILEDQLAGEARLLTEDQGEQLASKLTADISGHKKVEPDANDPPI